MNTETLLPASRQEWLSARAHDLTSTEVSALFKCNPWITEYELYFQHKNNSIIELEETNRMKWGKRLEQAIALCAADDKGWDVRHKPEYVRCPELRLGASFDYEAVDQGEPVLLEVKNVDAFRFKEGWLMDEEGNTEAPPHIEIQLQQQLMLTKLERGFIVALVGGNEIKYLERKADVGVQSAIVAQSVRFWEAVDKGVPPEPDFARDASFIASLYSNATEGKILDSSNDETFNNLMSAYKTLRTQRTEAETKMKEIKAKILMAAGDAAKVVGPWGSLSLGIVKGSTYTVEREAYRNFLPFFRKEK